MLTKDRNRHVVAPTLMSLLLISAMTVADQSHANPRLLIDADPAPSVQGSYPNNLVAYDNQVYFQGYVGTTDSGAAGGQLWRFDGSSAQPVAAPNYGGRAEIEQAVVAGSQLFFVAQDERENGSELWVSDGTQAGTHMVKEINFNQGHRAPYELTALNGLLYFGAYEGGGVGAHLWVSDGTDIGTQKVLDAGGNPLPAPQQMTPVGDQLFLLVEGDLWVTDGTPAGTHTLLNAPSGLSLDHFTAVGSRLFFVYQNTQLWLSDGTSSGTAMVADLAGLSSSSPVPDHLQGFGSKLYFQFDDGVNGEEMWVSDGTAAGTVMLLDINPAGDSYAHSFIPFNGELYFSANDGDGFAVWRSDGTAVNTNRFFQVPANNQLRASYVIAGNLLYFLVADDGNGVDLWRSNGQASGTLKVGDFQRNRSGDSRQPSHMTEVGNRLYFTAYSGLAGVELWQTDGSAAGTRLAANIAPDAASSDPEQFTAAGNGVYFSAQTIQSGRELWLSEGASTSLVDDIYPGDADANPEEITVLDNQAFFSASHMKLGDYNLWRSDGTAVGTQLLYATANGNARPNRLFELQDEVLFTADQNNGEAALFKANSSDNTAELVKDINSTAFAGGNDYRREATVLGGVAYFSANDGIHGAELWQTDGTSAGTQLAVDVVSGSDSSSPEQITAFGNQLLLTAYTQADGRELWRSDGRAAGTQLIANIHPGNNSAISQITVVGNVAYFIADNGVTGPELWRTNGTSGGTSLIKNIFPGQGAHLDELTAFNGKLYFQANDGVHGAELWVSDGSAAGTTLLADLWPGGDSAPAQLTVFDNTLYFTADDGTHGRELWQSDGTSVGTVLVADIRPGMLGANPQHLAVAGGLYFSADDGEHGREPWVMETQLSTGSGSIGDFVWLDDNENGIQDGGEVGLAGVKVNLRLNCDAAAVRATVSDGNGAYSFDQLPAGDYQLQFVAPAGYQFSPALAAGDYPVDSNASPIDGTDACRYLADGQIRHGLDVGLFGDGIAPEELSITDAFYNAAEDFLWIRVVSNLQPQGSATLTGSMSQQGQVTELGEVAWKPSKNAYQQNFKNIDCKPETVEIHSASGASAIAAVEGHGYACTAQDSISVVSAIYFMEQQQLWVRATSNAPAGMLDISAEVLANGQPQTMGAVGWKSDKDYYQQLFHNLTQVPEMLILRTSSGLEINSGIDVQQSR